MKAYLLAAAAAVMAVATPVQAAQYISLNSEGSTITGVFGNDQVSINESGAFTDTFNFTIGGNGIASATISSIFIFPGADLDFTLVSLNGIPFTVTSSGAYEAQFISGVPVSDPMTLIVSGDSGPLGAYSGTLNVTLSPVPEPAVWAMMITGFGLVGASMRRRRMTTVTA